MGSIDKELRNALWSLLTIYYWNTFRADYDSPGEIRGSNLFVLFRALWMDFFKEPIDKIPTDFSGSTYGPGGIDIVRDYYFGAEWNKAYDLVEFICDSGPERNRSNFIAECNTYLERENSGYRFVNGKIAAISSSEEINEIENAIESATPYYGVKKHLEEAISLMSDRTNPNYRNSIKESISAIEALCKTVSGKEKAHLSEAIVFLEKKGFIHTALKKAFNSLYGYTSDADGIRHALMEESNLTGADARFMLISCSAFINYVIARIN